MTRFTAACVTDPVLADLAVTYGEEIEVARRDVIFTQGDQDNQFYIIRSGKVKTCLNAGRDGEQLLEIHGPAEMFGELSMFDSRPRTSTAIAVTDVRAIGIGLATAREWINERPHLAEYMLRSLARQVRRTNDNRADLIFNDVPGRVARALLQLAARFGHMEGGTLRLVHDLTQTELAQYIGATRETVQRALSGFARRGWLQVEGRSVLIFDLDQLLRRAR
ncbi:Crp/Fnr family transcriptional regulator [Lentzea flaviverrucosa]|uniref:cAMP-binding domain of CRP or a regulatory subunit of cAMP-dependent protein kinases n=1 Tax=Lentzea flaviverrucosa TaxID=200379 RepID=A0A1H9EWU4_9PSEU|nr:Crp/Fnr family transcriptional regulator [Lentzea flaviverrucosa]RDI35373.1 CRP-like cAMP-binding protein [Lentzea flaviverrucosa]SEQ30121.1 cAMP-binding domain of CRP or a regulatory subunit of cAMP-dependent protein kinases [Lentzea flaviverrucosa]